MSRIGRGIAALSLCAFALGGCASTDLKTPIDGFATAATAAQSSLQTYDSVIDAAVVQTNTEAALKGGGVVRPMTSDCVLGATQCRIVLAEGGSELALTPQPLDGVARQVTAGIVTYATNLQTIVAIDTQTDVKAAADATLANIGQLTKDLDTAATTAGLKNLNLNNTVTPFLSPVSDTVAFGLGAYLDSKKLVALRTATKAMDSVLPDIVKLCNASINAGVAQQRANLFIAYQQAFSDYGGDRKSQTKLDALRTTSAAYDASLSVDTGAAFQQLSTAHKALTDALQEEKPSFGSALAAIQRAIAAAQKVQALVQEFQAAAKPAAT